MTKVKTLLDKPLNPDLVCQNCRIERDTDGEWVMDVYRCPDIKEYCLNCCGCPEHEEGEYYG